MTTELEKQFFMTFGIEPQTGIGLVKFKEPHYPQITDRHYLELICIFRQHKEMGYFTSVQELKKTLLTDFIEYYDRKINARIYTWLIEEAKQIKHQVQQLFKEN